jgi:3-hexulose-6-phosphate synthase/6-phospho-3-hexuloisomerase
VDAVTTTVQVSLDLHAIDDALRVAEVAVAAGVDWLEAGTGLVIEQGLETVRALRARFPRHPIVADLKVCDGGEYFGRVAAEAGATHMDVMASAHDATIRGAVRATQKHGIKIIADLMLSPDPVAAAVRAERLGVFMIGLHLGHDHRTENRGLSPMDGLTQLLRAVRIPIQVVGGLSVEQAIEAARLGAGSVVVGGPLVPGDRGPQLEATLRRVVEGVRAVAP